MTDMPEAFGVGPLTMPGDEPEVVHRYPPDTVILKLLLPVPVNALVHMVPLLDELGASDAVCRTVDGWLEVRTAPTLTIPGADTPPDPTAEGALL